MQVEFLFGINPWVSITSEIIVGIYIIPATYGVVF